MHRASRGKDWISVLAPSKSAQTLLSSLRSDEEALVDASYLPLIGAIVEMRLVPSLDCLLMDPVIPILIDAIKL